jgi:hypothetical protein
VQLADDDRQREGGAAGTQARLEGAQRQLEAVQQRQQQLADTVVQQRDLIRQLRGQVPYTLSASRTISRRHSSVCVGLSNQPLSSAGCGCLSLPDSLATPQGTDADSLRAEVSKAKLEAEQLTATVVKQRELIQVDRNIAQHDWSTLDAASAADCSAKTVGLSGGLAAEVFPACFCRSSVQSRAARQSRPPTSNRS